jgi:chemotaxis protein CheD
MNEVKTIEVNTGQVKIAKAPMRLRAPALGSCVAVTLYCNFSNVGGMAHVMLASTDHYLAGEDPLKYADEAIPYLIKLMVDAGANKYGIHAKLVGGAMITKDTMNIGQMVEISVEEILAKSGVEITARRIGGRASRTVTLDIATGILWYTENSGIEKAL